MPVLDSSMKRLIALFMGPLFLMLNGKFGLGITAETQNLVVESTMAYFMASKGGEVLIAQAASKAKVAAAGVVTPAEAENVLKRAAQAGAAE